MVRPHPAESKPVMPMAVLGVPVSILMRRLCDADIKWIKQQACWEKHSEVLNPHSVGLTVSTVK